MRWSRIRAALGLVLLLSAACATRPQAGPEVGAMSTARSIQVENESRVDLRITVLYGPVRTPIGTVRAMNSRPVRLPPGVPDNFNLMAEVVGGGMAGRLISETIYLSGERQASWVIRSNGTAHVQYGRSPTRP